MTLRDVVSACCGVILALLAPLRRSVRSAPLGVDLRRKCGGLQWCGL
jgi:hypothetical protein